MRKTHFHLFVFSSPGYNYFNKKNVKHFFVYKTQYRMATFSTFYSKLLLRARVISGGNAAGAGLFES